MIPCVWPGRNNLLLKNRIWKKWKMSLPRLSYKMLWLPLFFTLSLSPSHLLALMKQATMHGGPQGKELREVPANSQQGLSAHLQQAPSNCILPATKELGSRPCSGSIERSLQQQLTPDCSLVRDSKPEDPWGCAQIFDLQNYEIISACYFKRYFLKFRHNWHLILYYFQV